MESITDFMINFHRKKPFVQSPGEKTFYYCNVSSQNDLDESVYEIMRESASETEVYPLYTAQNPGSYGIIRICPEGILNT